MIIKNFKSVYLSDEVLKVLRYLTAEPSYHDSTVFLKLELPSKGHAKGMVQRIYSAARKKDDFKRSVAAKSKPKKAVVRAPVDDNPYFD